jgi:RNA polymerase sigma factor (sigma-70 family)
MRTAAKTLVERLFAEHYPALLAFFYRRVRAQSDAPDLAQEVYLRMLRVSDSEAIRNPEGYLFTVASNLAKEHAVLEHRRAKSIELDKAGAEPSLQSQPAYENDLDSLIRTSRLSTVLAQLSPKCRAAVVLQYSQDLSYQEIAARLNVSPHMVKKYLAQALMHCRRRMARLG